MASERVERHVVELLLQSPLTEANRESSTAWELKHSEGCCQIARMLAQKWSLDVEISEVAALLHDIYVILEGKYANHAALGAPIAEHILDEPIMALSSSVNAAFDILATSYEASNPPAVNQNGSTWVAAAHR